MKEFDVTDTDERRRSRIIKTAVTPRPIAWISTVDEDGVDNLAPFSSYNYVSSAQPVVLFNSPKGDTDELKDTARNALDTGEFAVNVVTEPLIEEMDATSQRLPPDESEFDAAAIERAACRTIEPSRVADAPVTMECTLYDSLEIHDRLTILGDVEYIHVSKEVMTDGEIDMTKIKTVGRLGGPYYTVSEPAEFERQY